MIWFFYTVEFNFFIYKAIELVLDFLDNFVVKIVEIVWFVDIVEFVDIVKIIEIVEVIETVA